MENQSISKNHWGIYFDLLSRMAQGKWMRLEVIANSIGDQMVKDWTLFEGMSYDQPKNVLSIHTPDLEHAISRPIDIVAYENGALRSIGIKDEDGQVQIIHFRDPLMLMDSFSSWSEAGDFYLEEEGKLT